MNPSPLHGVSPSARRFRSSTRCSHLLPAALCAALLASSFARPAQAGAAPLGESREPDPFDTLLDHEVPQRNGAPDTPAGGFFVGVETSFRASSQGASSFAGFAFVQIPVERLFGSSRRDLARLAFAEGPRAVRAERSGPRDAPERDPPPDDGTEEAAAKPVRTVLTVSSDVARGAVRAACKAQKLDEANARLDGLASRAKSSALLPELRLRVTRVIDETESLAPTEYDPLRRTASGGASTWLEARATFRLDRVLFADEEIAVERLRLARAAERTKLVAKVLELLDVWQRARTAEADGDAKPEARVRAALAAAASEAALDVITDGWFSRTLASQATSATNLPRAEAHAPHEVRDAAHPSAAPPSHGGGSTK